MRYLVPGPLPCPEVVAVFYIRLAEVPTLFSVEGDAQVEQQNTVVGFLTIVFFCAEERDRMMMVVGKKEVCELFETQTYYSNTYLCLCGQTKPAIG